MRLEMFMRVVYYFFGENVGKVKIDMTVPILTAVFKRSDRAKCCSSYHSNTKYPHLNLQIQK